VGERGDAFEMRADERARDAGGDGAVQAANLGRGLRLGIERLEVAWSACQEPAFTFSTVRAVPKASAKLSTTTVPVSAATGAGAEWLVSQLLAR
jgi:hypothetical protein